MKTETNNTFQSVQNKKKCNIFTFSPNRFKSFLIQMEINQCLKEKMIEAEETFRTVTLLPTYYHILKCSPHHSSLSCSPTQSVLLRLHHFNAKLSIWSNDWVQVNYEKDWQRKRGTTVSCLAKIPLSPIGQQAESCPRLTGAPINIHKERHEETFLTQCCDLTFTHANCVY